MMQRELQLDEFSHRRAYLQREIEKKADEISDWILKDAEDRDPKNSKKLPFADRPWPLDDLLEGPIEKLKTARTFPEKLIAITLYLNAIHYGGSNLAMFPGYPENKNRGGSPKYHNAQDVRDFFTTLNDL